MILSDLGAEAPSPWNWIEIAQSELLVLFHYDPWVSELDKQLPTAATRRKDGVPLPLCIKGHSNNRVYPHLTLGHHAGHGAVFCAHSSRDINANAPEYCPLFRSKTRS